jgi:OOP family OmpA-OmpF porin
MKLEIALSERIGVFASGEVLAFRDGPAPAPSTGLTDPGVGGLTLVGGGVRFRPLNDQSGYAIHVGDERHHRGNLFGNVWVDVVAGWVRTGALDRVGFGAGIGLELSLIDGTQVGPFVKYLQVLETESQVAPEDARIAMAGISVSVGAPGVHPSDRDDDGILDVDDRCPTRPEDPDDFEDADGCPELDNDHDDVPDVRDRCPIVPEDDDGFDDHDGCPEDGPTRPRAAEAQTATPEPVTETRDEEADILLEERVLFDTSKARVRTRYRPLVRQVQALMGEHPEYLRVRIEGHADERGTDAFNDWLSTERARRAAVVLERYGVDPTRIEIVGYGRRRPAVPGRRLNALRLNRRVNFRIVLVRTEVQVIPGVDSMSDEPPTGTVEPEPEPEDHEEVQP